MSFHTLLLFLGPQSPSRDCTAVCLPLSWLRFIWAVGVFPVLGGEYLCTGPRVNTSFVSLGLKPSDGTASHRVSLLTRTGTCQTVFSNTCYVGGPAAPPHWQRQMVSSFPLSNFNSCPVISSCLFNWLLTNNEVERLFLCLSVIGVSSWRNNVFPCFVFSFFFFSMSSFSR